LIDASNYTLGLPIAASTYAAKVDACLKVVHYGMFVVFVLWAIFFGYCLIRFRRKPGVAAGHGLSHGFGAYMPDVAVLVFEIWMIFFLGLPVWSTIKEDLPTESQSTVVELIGEQFAWGFQYPGADGIFGKRGAEFISSGNTIGVDPNDPAGKDDILSINQLHVPLGKPTLLYITSKDVIHSFFVPEFRLKQDLVPGMRIPIWFEANRTGTFEIGCAQLCGLGHYRMKGEVVVDTPEQFEAWKQEKIKEAQSNS
jgi:cytochrome c oxidase subunit 2